jgi:hypothetical protein
MVAPAVGAALIGAAGSLLGGLFAPKPKWVTPNYQDIRNKAEAAGFNPLTALTSAPGQAMQGANYMGSAIADAGLMLADAFSQSKRGQNLSKVQAENDKLKERVESLTLRPKVGGVYAARQAVPTVRQALGVKGASSASTGSPVSANAFDRMANSPFAGTVVGPDDDNLTGPQLSVKKDVPAFRLFGHDFYGTGAFSTGEQLESGVGESEIVSTLYAPLVITDAALNEANKTYQRYVGQPFVKWGKSLFEPNKARPKPVGKRPAWLPQGAYP